MAINLNNYVKQEIKTSYAIKVGDIFSDMDESFVFRCDTIKDGFLYCTLLEGDADGLKPEKDGKYMLCICDVIWQVLTPAKYKAYVLFGDDICIAYNNGSLEELLNDPEGKCFDITVREFETEAERDAYLLGINDHEDWVGHAVLTEKFDSEDIKLLENKGY